MKKIGLLSDTHSYMDDNILNHLSACDEIWHAGDFGAYEVVEKIETLGKPLRGVYGNIDGREIRLRFPEHLRFEIEGLQVWMTHIGGYPGKYPARIKNELRTNPPGLFICGHSHILKVIPDKEFGLLHINPGACGKEGFHRVRTIIRFEVDAGRVSKLEVVEMSRY
jgi:putative phosphoesterase